MTMTFNVRKAAQVVAYFALAEGGSINVLKLMKLVYLADREFIARYDTPILNDCFVSMDHGPVNSMTYNYVQGCEDRRAEWDQFVSDRANHQVAVADSKLSIENLDELSDAETAVLADVSSKFKSFSGYQLRDYTHENCPEWEDPDGSSEPIPIERILKFLGKKKNAHAIAESIATERALDRVFATR